jgi:hypothetical protein
MVLFFILLVGSSVLPAVQWGLKRYDDGIGFAGKRWDNSAIIQEVKRIPPDVLLYTNNFNALYILAGRKAMQLIPGIDPQTRRANPGYPALIEAMKGDLRDRGALVVYCHSDYAMFSESDLPTVNQLKREMPLRIISEVSDGTVYAWGY